MNLALGLAACMLSGAADDKGKKEAEVPSGTWTVVSNIRGGKEQPNNWSKVEFKEKEMSITMKNSKVVVPFITKVDASAPPATIELTSGAERILAIYEIKGDDMKLCFSTLHAVSFPTEFSGKEPAMALVTLKRDKKKEVSKDKKE
jgi:uncharacterized protein (TIGR03067 family)